MPVIWLEGAEGIPAAEAAEARACLARLGDVRPVVSANPVADAPDFALRRVGESAPRWRLTERGWGGAEETIPMPSLREAAEWIEGRLELRRRNGGDAAGALERAASLLRRGGVVAFPTETVYGLGASAFDERAVARIFEIKGRPRFDPLIVHVESMAAARTLVETLPPSAERLMARFWPGPLTLALPRRPEAPDIVTAGLPTVALRCPRHPAARELLRRTGLPLAAPSANRFGCASPTTAEAVVEQLGTAPDAIVDGGACPVGIESTILAVEEGGFALLRPGGVPLEEIEEEVGPVRLMPAGEAQPLAPGRLARHYAPRTPLFLLPDEATPPAEERGRIGWIGLKAPPEEGRYAAIEALSPAGDLRAAAARLFAALRWLDAQGLDRIYAAPLPERGLGRAINDRLRRAASAERTVGK